MSSDRRPLVRKKILAVDDSPVYLGAIFDVLREDGYTVVPALSGEEALEVLAGERFDAVILDLLMPGIDGLETCRRIRNDPRLQHMPVMMLTGREDEKSRLAGIAAGVDEFVIKSPALELVRVRLRALLRGDRAKHEAHADSEKEPKSGRGAWRAQSVVPPGSLLYRVVMATGLADMIGPATISSACRRAGVDVKTTSPADLDRALPAIGEALRMFLSREEIDQRLAVLRGLAAGERGKGPWNYRADLVRSRPSA